MILPGSFANFFNENSRPNISTYETRYIKKHIGTHHKGLLTIPYCLYQVNGIFHVILTKLLQPVFSMKIDVKKWL